MVHLVYSFPVFVNLIQIPVLTTQSEVQKPSVTTLQKTRLRPFTFADVRTAHLKVQETHYLWFCTK